MKILFINHHFRYDIDALVYTSGGKHIIKEISPQYFYERSKGFLPASIFFSTVLEEEYTSLKYQRHRKKWIAELRKAIFELYRIFQFDVIVSPSYVFFYIYDLPQILTELGIPFIIVQKETSRPPSFIEKESKVVKKLYPFFADFMTVCGPDQVEFSLASGVPASKFDATGQPRFDFYKNPKMWKSKSELRIPETDGKKVVLFLTYYLNCAVPPSASYHSLTLWEDLRTDTEKVLIDIALKNDLILLVKPHPQQPPSDMSEMEKRFKTLTGSAWEKSVIMIKPEADARNLIVHSDIVVGFQTTALLEAIAAGKNVIYTFWTETVKKLKEELLPYHEYEPLIKVARSKGQLRDLLLDDIKKSEYSILSKNIEAFEERLGPLDGKASERVWHIIEKEFGKINLKSDQIELRRKLFDGRVSYCKREIKIIRMKIIALSAMSLIFSKFKNSRLLRQYYGTSKYLIETYQKRIRECSVIVDGDNIKEPVLIGRFNLNLFFRIKVLFYKFKKK